MANLSASVAKQLAGGAEDALRQAASVITGNQGGYIKDGEPESVYGKAQLATARQACRRYADDPSKFSGAASVLVENACRPYLDDIGYGTAPSLELPFRGGQCCGATYEFTYTFRNPNTGQLQSAQNTANNVQIIGLFERSNQPAQPTKSGGPRYRRCDTGAIQDVPLGTTFETMDLEQSISNIVRTDGGPDNCGSPPPEIEGPVPPPNPGPATEPFTGPGIDIDITVEIGPTGTINVDFGTGPIEINPFEPVDPAGGGGATPGQNPAGSPESIGEPIDGGPGTPNEGGDIDFGAPPAGRVWVGCMLQVLYPEQAGVLPNSVGGQAVFPRVVGNLSLKHGPRRSSSQRVRSEWSTLFRESEALPVDGAAVGVLPSFSYRVYPVSLEICPEDSCSTQEV